jgi:hypothetical protein
MRLVQSVMVVVALSAGFRTADAGEVRVASSHAACRSTANVERFEQFERADDDSGYKQLYLSTGATRECIFLRAGETIFDGPNKGGWACVKLSDAGDCYWTRPSVLN